MAARSHKIEVDPRTSSLQVQDWRNSRTQRVELGRSKGIPPIAKTRYEVHYAEIVLYLDVHFVPRTWVCGCVPPNQSQSVIVVGLYTIVFHHLTVAINLSIYLFIYCFAGSLESFLLLLLVLVLSRAPLPRFHLQIIRDPHSQFFPEPPADFVTTHVQRSNGPRAVIAQRPTFDWRFERPLLAQCTAACIHGVRQRQQ